MSQSVSLPQLGSVNSCLSHLLKFHSTLFFSHVYLSLKARIVVHILKMCPLCQKLDFDLLEAPAGTS